MIVRAVTLVWCLSVGAGLVLLAGYAARPCDTGDPTPQWPSSSRIPFASDRATLVLFVDPNCPCSRASLAELERSLALCLSPVAAHLIVSSREGKVAVPSGVEVLMDDRGEERRRFGVVTSGHMLLFDPKGNRVFSGGITSARGHEGDSLGGDAVVALASGKTLTVNQAPVFGCPLPEAAVGLLSEPVR